MATEKTYSASSKNDAGKKVLTSSELDTRGEWPVDLLQPAAAANTQTEGASTEGASTEGASTEGASTEGASTDK